MWRDARELIIGLQQDSVRKQADGSSITSFKRDQPAYNRCKNEGDTPGFTKEEPSNIIMDAKPGIIEKIQDVPI